MNFKVGDKVILNSNFIRRTQLHVSHKTYTIKNYVNEYIVDFGEEFLIRNTPIPPHTTIHESYLEYDITYYRKLKIQKIIKHD